MVELLASAAAGVSIRSLRGTPGLQAADRLLRRVWNIQPGEDPPMALDVMCALAHTGGYIGGAYLGDRLAGVSAGWLAAGGTLHSHVAGVAPEAQGRGVGNLLKAHQREWAAERGLTAISWTFDPLVRRNAYFNLVKLRAFAVDYLPDFYGPMSDGINDGDVSDRLLVRWPVVPASGGVSGGASGGASGGVSGGDELLAGSEVIVDEAGAVLSAGNAPLLRCATPADVEGLRRDDPAAARRWRAALGTALSGALTGGYRITGFTRSGWYLLARGDVS
ncbi:GNAT family N-acetyltransferase [Sinosporangium siamense]|uniref:BioF2-like acetyltransferase domain-containing protein n=1 Tax=Sinosporangium siamense TaxID=1367973 RepID=A0A919VEB2_9ACTN|nr:GNAT family N-acetyltransferase [Sinosporangium siamense]GII94954.1 hypothetical protein Ssi02_51850 [Sinosporangium siamense]